MIDFVTPIQRSGGVHDFSCKLSQAIGVEGSRLIHLSKENARDWEVGRGNRVILQYSGYGFEKRGVPLWLLEEIEKRRTIMKSFGVFFHELYAFGPPWSSSFWLSPVQRHIARRLAVMSDFWLTNREGSAKWLRQFSGNKPHSVLPVFSNVGEPDSFLESRLRRIVVFGSPGLRQATYNAAGLELFAWAERAALEVHDVGAPIQDLRLDSLLRRNGVTQHGRLPDSAISGLLKTSLYGLLAYPVDYVAKSGVLAAYCAHKLCPVLWSNEYADADGLVAGRDYLAGLAGVLATGAEAVAIGESACTWYERHQLSTHVTTLQELLGAWE